MDNQELNRKRFWNSYSKKYDSFIAKYANRSYIQLIELIKPEMEETPCILEIGTGTGIMAFEVNKLVQQVTAIDYAKEMIEIARSKKSKVGNENITFEVGSAYDLKYPNQTFDAIIISNILHQLKSPEDAIGEIIRVLKERGKVIMPTYCHGENLKSYVFSKLMSIIGLKVINRWSVNAFKRFVEDCGLIIKKEKIIKDKIPVNFIVALKA